jgi:hypothetical protein
MKRLLLILAAAALVAGCMPAPIQVQLMQAPEATPVAVPGVSERALGDTNLTNLVLDGDLTVGDDAIITGDLTVSGTSTVTADPANLEVGGGFGGGAAAGSGISFTAAGGGSFDGALYTRSTLGVTGVMTTTDRVSTGGGWSSGGGGSGCELSAAGDIGCDGNGYFGGTLGVTGAFTATGNTDLTGTLQYGANNLYPVGYASSGKAIVTGQATTVAVGSVGVTHGLSSVDSVQATVCQVPTTAAAFANAVITATTVTLEGRDSTLSSRTNGVVICYTVIGTR